MVSRRIFFSICIMMAVILVLFMASLLLQDLGSDYRENKHLTETKLTQSTAWEADRAMAPPETVVYIGSAETPAAGIVRQWGNYTKRRVEQFNSVEEYQPGGEDAPVLLCLAGSEISTNEEVSMLSALADEGQAIVFCDLPEPSVLKGLPALRALLGIQEIVQEEVELTGIKLFSGFFLGGDVIYEAVNEKQEEMQDLELSVPWYLPSQGTRTYMVGLLGNSEVENEALPGLIWRRSHGDARIFAVNGSYMHDQTGLGILSAVINEIQGFELHPVVNAQNLSVANFPDFAMENTEQLTEIYARNMRRVQMDLMWPHLIAASNKGRNLMTCFLTPEMDYVTRDEQFPQDLDFYLRQFKGQNAEAGLSLDYLPGIDLLEKTEADRDFFEAAESGYKYGAVYVKREDRETFAALAWEGVLDGVKTMTGIREDTDPIVSYFSDTIVDQGVTADAFFYTYSQDLRVRAVETALGYSNILVDMKRGTLPEEDAPHWEVLYESFSSNINTFWKPFAAFDKTTISESDQRIRAFLAVDYTVSREGDSITVEISNRNGDAWFLLRTNLQSVLDITGGTCRQLEEGAYLICAQEDHLEISIEPEIQLKYSLS